MFYFKLLLVVFVAEIWLWPPPERQAEAASYCFFIGMFKKNSKKYSTTSSFVLDSKKFNENLSTKPELQKLE